MIKVLLFDLSRTLLFPKDKSYKGELNKLHKGLLTSPDYNFSDHFYLDEEIIRYITNFKNKYRLYIFTSGSIQNVPEIHSRLERVFDKIYSAEEIGFNKKDPKSYEFIAKNLNVKPQEILFIDNSEENVNVAKLARLNAFIFSGFINLKRDLEKLLS